MQLASFSFQDIVTETYTEDCFQMTLEACGFFPVTQHTGFPPEGVLYRFPEHYADGYYWIYYKENMFNIKIHDFSYHKDTIFEVKPGEWPKCLSQGNSASFHRYRNLSSLLRTIP